MGRMSRNKGKRGEREVIAILQPMVAKILHAHGVDPVRLKRDTRQSDGGGFDISGLDWLAPEVKRCETVRIPAWWRQACGQAKGTQAPALLWRTNGSRWQARVRDVRGTHDMTMEQFMDWFARHLHAHALDVKERQV